MTLLLALGGAGCVADATDRAPRIDGIDISVESAPSSHDTGGGGRDICEMASELSPDNICSLMCDPDAMKAKLSADGSPGGRCYDFACDLADQTRVDVGVCLEPTAPKYEHRIDANVTSH